MLNRRIWTLSCLLTALLACSRVHAEETKEVEIKEVKFQIPDSWKKQEPKNNVIAASFEIKPVEGEDAAEMTVSAFGNSGGGVPANVSRWVSQFEAEGRKVTVTQGKSAVGDYVLVDLKGTYNKPIGPPIRRQTKRTPESRMLGAIIAVEGKGNYFLKLTGGQKTIEKQVENFRKSFKADKDSEKPYEQ